MRNPLSVAEARYRAVLEAAEHQDGRVSRDLREFVAIMTSTHMQVCTELDFIHQIC